MGAGFAGSSHMLLYLPISGWRGPNPAGEAFDTETTLVLGSWNAVAPEAATDCSLLPPPHGLCKVQGQEGPLGGHGIRPRHSCMHACLLSTCVPRTSGGS